jgi:hypothetical protein
MQTGVAMKMWIAIVVMLLTGVAQGQTTKPAGATTKPVKGMSAPNAEQLMNSMLKPPSDGGRVPIQPLPDPPKVDPATGKIVPPNPPTPLLKREGSFVFDLTGRLQKAGDGNGWEIVFDSDGQQMQDPPMGVIPNQKLASMELIIQGVNHDPKFKVTGMVTEYKGKNYLLLEKATLVSDALQQF